MNTASARRRESSTATLGASRHEMVRVTITDRVARLRAAMVNSAPWGFQERVSDLMRWRRQRVTREVTAVEKLSVEHLLAQVALHRAEGREDEADRLLGVVNEDQPIRVTTGRAVVIRMRDGQMELGLE